MLGALHPDAAADASAAMAEEARATADASHVIAPAAATGSTTAIATPGFGSKEEKETMG